MPFRSLIDVRPPYYALSDVELRKPGVVTARVMPEHPLGHEVGSLAAAEAGRHLAILGSCACSSLREPVGKHYYLAQRALLISHDESTLDSHESFIACAESVLQKPREVTARAVLCAANSGNTLFELDVSYKVMSQAAFARVFAAHRRDLRGTSREDRSAHQAPKLLAQRRNPYRDQLPLEITQRSHDGVQARLGVITPELCAGHFPMFPALPVAVLMHSLSTLCGEALRVRWGQSTRYRVRMADVSAARLAFAGESLRFDASYLSGDGEHERYQARALLDDGTAIGHMLLELEPISAELPHNVPDLRRYPERSSSLVAQ